MKKQGWLPKFSHNIFYLIVIHYLCILYMAQGDEFYKSKKHSERQNCVYGTCDFVGHRISLFFSSE